MFLTHLRRLYIRVFYFRALREKEACRRAEAIIRSMRRSADLRQAWGQTMVLWGERIYQAELARREREAAKKRQRRMFHTAAARMAR